MKKFCLFILFTACFVSGFSQKAVTLSKVNLREGNNVSSKIIAVISKNTYIQLDGCDNGWCKTEFNHRTVFVSESLVRLMDEPRSAAAPSTAEHPKYYTNSDKEKVQSPTYYDKAPAGATAECRDGTYSFSKHRRGSCSSHGGVKKWL